MDASRKSGSKVERRCSRGPLDAHNVSGKRGEGSHLCRRPSFPQKKRKDTQHDLRGAAVNPENLPRR